MRQTRLTHQFVEFIPERIAEGVIYISKRYGTAAHNCCCGCGKEVVTPINPTDWSLHVEGDLISLYPSIGNWGFPCRSHYWIRRSEVVWAGQMSQQRIEHGRAINRATKQMYFEAVNRQKDSNAKLSLNDVGRMNLLYKIWWEIKRWWSSLR